MNIRGFNQGFLRELSPYVIKNDNIETNIKNFTSEDSEDDRERIISSFRNFSLNKNVIEARGEYQSWLA